MFRRVFWFGVGAGAAVYAVVKVRAVLEHATPKAISHRVTGSAVGVTESIRGFTAQVRAAMAERETELRDALGLND